MNATSVTGIGAGIDCVRQQVIDYLRLIALFIFPVFIVVYVILYLVDHRIYLATLGEEDYLEQLSVINLLFSSAVAFVIAFSIRRHPRSYSWFFLAFGAACFVFAMEEINWGQRIVGVETPDFFRQHSDQSDINLHNLMQGLLDIRTKDIAGIVLLLYGGILPFFAGWPRLAALLRRFRFVVPPRFLTLGFILGATLMLDVPTTDEEELGEFLFSLCFVLFMLYELAVNLSDRDAQRALDWLHRIRRDHMRAFQTALPGALTLVAFGVSLWGIGARPLYLEEAALAFWAQAPLAEIREVAWQHVVSEPVIWLLLLRVWTSLAGQSEFALRFLPALAGTLGVVLVWKWLETLRVHWVVHTLITLALMLSPVLLFYSQHTVAHNFTVVFAPLSILIVAKRLTQRISPRWLAAWVLANWVMVVLNPYTVAVLVGELVWLAVVLIRRGGLAWPKSLWVGSAFLISLIPPAGRLWWPAAEGVPAVSILRTGGALQAERWSWAGVQMARLLQGQPLARIYDGLAHPMIALAVSLGLVVLLLLMAVAAVYLWRKGRGLGVAAMALLFGMILWGSIMHYYRLERNEFREVATYLETHAQPDHGVLLQVPQQVFPLRYYLGESAHLIPVPEIDLAPNAPAWEAIPQVVPEVQDDQLLDALQQHPALWLVHFEDRTVDPNAFVRHFLTAVAHHTDCVIWPSMEVCGFVSPMSTLAAQAIPLDAAYGSDLRLDSVEITLPQESASNLPYLLVTLYWQALESPPTDYKISLRLADEMGAVLAQQDDLLVGPLLPPSTWAAGDNHIGHMALPLPADLPAGSYQVLALVYDGATGAPVDVQTAAAASDSLLPLTWLAYDRAAWSHE